jgi:hypothetical protein
MRTPTYDEYLANPDAILASVEQAARAERAEAIQHFIVAPLKRMWKRMAQTPAQRLQTQSA